MTLVSRTFDQLKEILERDGWKLVSTDFFDEYNRIVFAKHGHSFALPYRRVYFYPFIVIFLTNLGIEPPADCVHAYQQHQQSRKNGK